MLLLRFLLTPFQEVAVANMWVQASGFSCDPLFSFQTSLLQSLPPITFPSGCLQKVETKASKGEQGRTRCRPFGHLIYPLFIVRFLHFRRQGQWCPRTDDSMQMSIAGKIQGAIWVWKIKILRKGPRPSQRMLTASKLLVSAFDQRKQNKARTRWDGDAPRKGRSHKQPRQWGGADAFPTSDADWQDWHPDTGTYWVTY